MSVHRLPTFEEKSLKAQVSEALRDAIFTGKLAPGEALAEQALAKELRVSQVTVREALIWLEQNGLVVRYPNRGTRVTLFSVAEMAKRLQIRIVLEGMACGEAAPLLTPAHYSALDDRLERLNRAGIENNNLELLLADLDFHSYIWEQCGNPVLCGMLKQLTVPMFAFSCLMRTRGVVAAKRIKNPHEIIVEVLRGGDPAAIPEVVRSHIQDSYEIFLKSIPEEPAPQESRLEFFRRTMPS